MTRAASVRIVHMAMSDERGGLRSVHLDLPMAWARHVDAVRVRLQHRDVLGWHATVVDVADSTDVLDLAWHDDVDRDLLGDGGRLPLRGESWDDLDQCWLAHVHRAGEALYVAESDLDALLDVLPAPPRRVRPGHLEVAGVEVTWHRVCVNDWELAWREARAFFEARGPGLSAGGPPQVSPGRPVPP